jgi:hypothetical protein
LRQWRGRVLSAIMAVDGFATFFCILFYTFFSFLYIFSFLSILLGSMKGQTGGRANTRFG